MDGTPESEEMFSPDNLIKAKQSTKKSNTKISKKGSENYDVNDNVSKRSKSKKSKKRQKTPSSEEFSD